MWHKVPKPPLVSNVHYANRILKCISHYTVDQDYLAQNRTVAVMENSNFTYQFPIELLADDVVEGNETLSLHLSSSESKVPLNTPTTTITIIDDDKSKLSSML